MKRVPKCLRHPLWLVAVVLLAWYLSFGYKYGFIYNHGISMQPTISNGEWIIMQKRSAMKEGWTPDRYDVVIIDDVKSGETLSKRIIGLPGDTIEVREGVVYLNGKELEYPFGKGKVEMTSHEEEKVIEGHVWVIGDNRAESWHGMLPIGDIEGLAVIY